MGTTAKPSARFYAALAAGKLSIAGLALLRRSGTQLPGTIADRIDPAFLAHIGKPDRVVYVTGTNGKTTTSNLLDDLLQANGFDPLTNREGGNIKTGIESALMKNATLTGRARKTFACMELDELSSRLVCPHMPPDILLVTNLYRDSFLRNAHPDYIADVLSRAIPDSCELVLNADDMISCRLAPTNRNRVYYSIARLPGDFDGPEGIVSDLTACPECGGALAYDYCHLRHLGHATCTSCGFTNPAPDYEVVAVDLEAKTFTVRENCEPGAPEQAYHIESYSVVNLYDLLGAVVVARRLGIPAADIARSLASGINVTPLRFSEEEIDGKPLVAMASKGWNGTATSSCFQRIREAPGRKAAILMLADAHMAAREDASEFCGWYYQADFEYLADPDIAQVVVQAPREEDVRLRLLLAGVDPAKIVAVRTPEEAADAVDLARLDGVYWAYDLYNRDDAHASRAHLIASAKGAAR